MQNDQITLIDDDEIVPLDQQESEEDIHLKKELIKQSVMFNTDWTVETLFRQIDKGNIDLDPKFQRRDAWDLTRKSKLIESIICGFPIPNVVLAEHQSSKGKYLVIDGKQRLSSIASFLRDEFALSGLQILENLNGKKFSQIAANFQEEANTVENQTIRTVIIRNWPDEDYLYTVFYRLNSGSLPLSSQELRKALHGGRLLDYLDDFIRNSDAYKLVFGGKIDRRMRDVELALRFISFDRFYNSYKGDLKKFLDESVIYYDRNWDTGQAILDDDLAKFDNALITTHEIFGIDSFKKWNGENFERRINRAVFDTVARYFGDHNIRAAAITNRDAIVMQFKDLCQTNEEFKNAIERTTKTPAATNVRYRLWGERLARILGLQLNSLEMRLF